MAVVKKPTFSLVDKEDGSADNSLDRISEENES